METVSTVIVKPYVLQQDPASCYYLKLSFLRQYLNTFSCKLLSQNAHLRYYNPDRPLITAFEKVTILLAQATDIQFNLIVIDGGSCLYRNCKVILYQRSRIYIVCQRLCNIQPSATKVNGFSCKARTNLDIAGLPNPPLITIFSKVTFNFMRQLSSLSI